MEFNDLNLLAIGNTIQMVGAIYEGEGEMILVFLPDYHAEVLSSDTPEALPDCRIDRVGGTPVHSLNMSLAEWEQFLRQTDVMETEILAKAKDGTLVKALARKSQRQIDQVVSWKVFKRDGYRCRYCGNDDVPLTVDHLVRWEEGGPSIEANLLTADKKCNRIRGNMSYADWLKHPAYRDTSRRLKPEVRAANEALVATLDKIPRVVHVKSR